MQDHDAAADSRREDERDEKELEESERFELLDHLQELIEPLMVGLGLMFLVLLIVDFAGAAQTPAQQTWLDRGLTAIWFVFVLDFGVRFFVAPNKLAFLRANWLSAASLALPFLRPFRVLRALRAARSLRLVRLLGGANRGMRVLRQVARGRQLVYIGTLTLLVTVLGAVGVLYFDRDVQDATIHSFGDAMWWSAAMMTTMNNEKFAVSAEARVVAILLRLFAVSVIGLFTAAVASYFVGREVEERAKTREAAGGVDRGIADLRRENERLREELIAIREVVERLPGGDRAAASLERPAARSPKPVSPAASGSRRFRE